MFWVILGIIAIIISIIWAIKNAIEWESFISFMVVPFVVFMAFLISILGIGLSNIMATGVADTEVFLEHEWELHLLNYNIETEEQYFIGTGSFDSKPKYYVMLKTEMGYEMKTYDISEVTLIYSDIPRVEFYKNYYTNPVVRFFCGEESLDTHYKIYVPEGSILNNYQVDLE